MWDNVSQECNMNWNNVRWRNNINMSCWVWPLTICELVAKWKWIWMCGYWNLSVLKWNSTVQGNDGWGLPVFVRCAVTIGRPQCVQIGAESPCNKCLYATQMWTVVRHVSRTFHFLIWVQDCHICTDVSAGQFVVLRKSPNNILCAYVIHLIFIQNANLSARPYLASVMCSVL